MAHQPKAAPLALGSVAPGWTLSATDGREYALPRDHGAKGTVVFFTCNHCPYVKAYDARINALAKEFAPKGIAFFGINANDVEAYPDDSFAKMQEKSRAQALPYTYLRDDTQQAALDYGAGCTPEFFCFNAQLRLVYTGRLDDNMEEPKQVQHPYLRDAITAVLAGTTPPTQQSHAIGCSVKWKG
ncbi:MAG: thioredoxin family protein [Deltaproteobacteria bacterium]|nr:thioredoxin family protein [Deltaproteobacteria bacterium]